jgi:RNA polymerase sigma-70 factor (ECF subfamily)
VRLYSPLVVHWIRRWGVPSREIADLLQEVFRAVARRVGTFRRERHNDTFRGWLRQISLNKVRDYYRRAQNAPRPIGGTDMLDWLQKMPMAADSTEDELEESVWRGVLNTALESVRAEIKATTWTAFWETVVEGRSAVEVAEQLNMSPGAIRIAKCRVLQKLREVLGDSMD